jgi:hypothetical protein
VASPKERLHRHWNKVTSKHVASPGKRHPACPPSVCIQRAPVVPSLGPSRRARLFRGTNSSTFLLTCFPLGPTCGQPGLAAPLGTPVPKPQQAWPGQARAASMFARPAARPRCRVANDPRFHFARRILSNLGVAFAARPQTDQAGWPAFAAGDGLRRRRRPPCWLGTRSPILPRRLLRA